MRNYVVRDIPVHIIPTASIYQESMKVFQGIYNSIKRGTLVKQLNCRS